MAKVTLVFAVLLAALGLGGYRYTGSHDATLLIATWIGLALGVCGYLAISPNERRRKLFMHINAAIGLLSFLGSVIMALNFYGSARSEGLDVDPIALGLKVALILVLLIYLNLCVRSFIAARSSGKV
jgi:hypothetical protein